MLPKKHRFTRSEFSALTARTDLKTVYNRIGTLNFIHGGRKFAVVTSSKHEKRAIVRNRLRRRVYDFFRKMEYPLSGVLYTSKQSYGFDVSEVKSFLTSLFSHAEDSK